MKNIRKSTLIILFGSIWIFIYFVVIIYGTPNLTSLVAAFNLIMIYVIVIILVFKFLINNFGTKQIVQQNKEILEKMNEMQQKIDEMHEKINEK